MVQYLVIFVINGCADWRYGHESTGEIYFKQYLEAFSAAWWNICYVLPNSGTTNASLWRLTCYFWIRGNNIMWFLCSNQRKVNLRMIQAEINQLHQLYPLQPLAMGKVLHQRPTQARNWKLLLSSESSPSMSLNQQQGILDQRVFLVRVGLVVFSRDGLMGLEQHLSNLVQGLLLQWKPSIMMDFRVIKNGLYDTSSSTLILYFYLEGYLFCLFFFFYFHFSYDLWIFSCFNYMAGWS